MPAPTIVMNKTIPAIIERQGVFFFGVNGEFDCGGVFVLSACATGGAGTSPGSVGGNGEIGDGVEPTTLIM